MPWVTGWGQINCPGQLIPTLEPITFYFSDTENNFIGLVFRFQSNNHLFSDSKMISMYIKKYIQNQSTGLDSLSPGGENMGLLWGQDSPGHHAYLPGRSRGPVTGL